MNIKIKTVVLILTLTATSAIVHSCFKQKLDTNDALPKIDRGQLCQDGGATIDQSTNECICTGGTTWNGVRCDVPSKEDSAGNVEATVPESPPPPPVLPEIEKADSLGDTEKDVSEAISSEVDVPKVEESSAEFLSLVRRACRIGNGTWLKKFEYCHCPDGKVLMGRRCRPMNGRMIDDVCLRAVNKGTWNGGICECGEGEVFSPGRGGCMKTPITDKTLLRRICVNSMNLGRWNDTIGECSCPSGKIMVGETCENKSKMTSSEVCESAANSGKWDVISKRCDCPNQKIWANQSCLGVGEVDAETACISATNRGTWIKAKGRCACPKGERWIPSKKLCIAR
jgi:hypothetical protein